MKLLQLTNQDRFIRGNAYVCDLTMMLDIMMSNDNSFFMDGCESHYYMIYCDDTNSYKIYSTAKTVPVGFVELDDSDKRTIQFIHLKDHFSNSAKRCINDKFIGVSTERFSRILTIYKSLPIPHPILSYHGMLRSAKNSFKKLTREHFENLASSSTVAMIGYKMNMVEMTGVDLFDQRSIRILHPFDELGDVMIAYELDIPESRCVDIDDSLCREIITDGLKITSLDGNEIYDLYTGCKLCAFAGINSDNIVTYKRMVIKWRSI